MNHDEKPICIIPKWVSMTLYPIFVNFEEDYIRQSKGIKMMFNKCLFYFKFR